MNAFSNYKPELSWSKHDTSKMRDNGTKGAEKREARMTLPGSLRGAIPLIDIPSRDSINTETTSGADKRHALMKGGI
jgi:hypothetical protein